MFHLVFYNLSKQELLLTRPYDASKPGLVDSKFKVSGKLVWTSELDADPSFAWYFNFFSGGEFTYTRNPLCNFYFYALAVRSLR